MFVNDRKYEKEANRIFYNTLAVLSEFLFIVVYFVGMQNIP